MVIKYKYLHRGQQKIEWIECMFLHAFTRACTYTNTKSWLRPCEMLLLPRASWDATVLLTPIVPQRPHIKLQQKYRCVVHIIIYPRAKVEMQYILVQRETKKKEINIWIITGCGSEMNSSIPNRTMIWLISLFFFNLFALMSIASRLLHDNRWWHALYNIHLYFCCNFVRIPCGATGVGSTVAPQGAVGRDLLSGSWCLCSSSPRL